MSAIISECGTYRYRLERDVGMDGPTYAFFGINPSTADATVNDATVRKWIGFVKKWGGRRFIVGNVFAYRATDVRELSSAIDPHGPGNADHLARIVADADVLVPCWGRLAKLPPNLRSRPGLLLDLLRGSNKEVECFGWTSDGSPKHPLMLGYDTMPVCV